MKHVDPSAANNSAAKNDPELDELIDSLEWTLPEQTRVEKFKSFFKTNAKAILIGAVVSVVTVVAVVVLRNTDHEEIEEAVQEVTDAPFVV